MNPNANAGRESRVPDTSTSHDQPRAVHGSEITGLHTALERAFIDEYLASRGHTLRSIGDLPPAEREPLLRAATSAATLKLAEIEARAHLLERMA